MLVQEPPKARGGFAQRLGGALDGHLAQQQQGAGFKLLAEAARLAFPRRTHPPGMTALGTAPARQPRPDLTAILHHVEMPPTQRLSAVVAFGFRTTLGTTFPLPHFVGVFELQIHLAAVLAENAFGDSPLQSQPQQFGKQFLGCHTLKACPILSSPKTSENR